MDTPIARWRLFLGQYAADHGDGWQSELARRLGVTASAIQKHASGERKNPREMIDKVVDRIGVDRGFFYDSALGDEPHYREHRRRPTVSAQPSSATNAYWRRFELLGVAERLGLTAEQVAWVRDAPFRGGAQSVDDYIGAAEMIVRADLVPPDGHEAARTANAAAGNRIKLGGG